MSVGTGDADSATEKRSFPDLNPGRIVRGTLGTAGFLVLWWVASSLVEPAYLLPSPAAAASAFVEQLTMSAWFTVPLVGTEIRTSRMVVKLAQTLLHYVPGLLVGASSGIAFGIALGWSGRLDDALTPVVRVLRPIPPLAWVVFAIVWFGIGHAGAAFIVFVGAFWINVYGAYSGVEDTPGRLTEVASSLGVRADLGMIRHVVLPSAAPQILTSFRTSIGRCLMIVVGAELFGAPGVGYEILNASNNLAMDTSVAYMLVISLVYLVTDGAFRGLEGRMLAWRE
ncbi:ABC transporter permease [Halococcus hamelinensis]|uniref:Nitrate/sulfonate/bicarbonate ABC transporter permease n=1 Tax=Halococcus hamelinensis 100A6 TaxID=1132509 RepID=M0M045_9EURY|nr:ABC transporter permease [Halococcus hamelinensis]EMA37984.1 nitrate/sulfonate/bicarbonate ABC transporter permease [Halococcus hamelinensis 100A6]